VESSPSPRFRCGAHWLVDEWREAMGARAPGGCGSTLSTWREIRTAKPTRRRASRTSKRSGSPRRRALGLALAEVLGPVGDEDDGEAAMIGPITVATPPMTRPVTRVIESVSVKDASAEREPRYIAKTEPATPVARRKPQTRAPWPTRVHATAAAAVSRHGWPSWRSPVRPLVSWRRRRAQGRAGTRRSSSSRRTGRRC